MVKKNDGNESTPEISRQAAVWWLLLKERRRLSMEEGWRFILWLMRSRRHLCEFILIGRLDVRLTRVVRSERDQSRAEPDQSNVTHVNWWHGSSLKPAETRDRRHIAGWGVAASVLLLLPMVFLLPRMNDVETADGTIATAANEAKTRRLEDGSRVSLNADSTLRVEFTGKRRDVHLLQGKAIFDVERDTKRPFVVNTFLVDIAAVESKFAVKIDTSVEVAVYEGVVEVSGRSAKAGAPVITVKPGETYRVPIDRFRAIVANGSDSSRAELTDG